MAKCREQTGGIGYVVDGSKGVSFAAIHAAVWASTLAARWLARRGCGATPILVAVLLILASGCGEFDLTNWAEESETVATTEDPLSGLGMEKLIPLRIINAMNCDPSLPTCNWQQRYEGSLRSIEFANGVFAGAGVQFWIKSFEGNYMPDFVDLSECFRKPMEDGPPWSKVKGQLRRAFPRMSDRKFCEDDQLRADQWLVQVGTVVGARDNPEEFVVWVVDVVADEGLSYGFFPEIGRGVIVNQAGLTAGGTVFAHEMGHALGLQEVFKKDTRSDPQTLATRSEADRWDLVFLPGTRGKSGHRFFNSKEEVEKLVKTSAKTSRQIELQLINTHTRGNNCKVDPKSGVLECTIGDCGGLQPNPTCVKETYVRAHR